MRFNFEVREIHKATAIQFVQKYHYSPVMPKLTKHYLGVFLGKSLKGVLTLGWGTQPLATINKMFPDAGLTTKDYFEIGKMCMDEEMPHNSESQMLSCTVKWMKDNTSCLFLYTMADGIMGKCGYVYQASNFYFGEKYFTQVYLMENGEKLHPRSTKSLLKENALFSGREKLFWMTTDFMKSRGIRKISGYMFRYIYPLSKKAKKCMKKNSCPKMDWTNMNYPKDKDLEWFDITDTKNKMEVKRPNFTFVDAKYNSKNIESGGGHGGAGPQMTVDDFF